MEKLATQLLDKAKAYMDENPELVRNVLGAGAVGAGAGALLGGSSDPHETTGDKIKRRIKNALIGGAMAGGAAGLLSNSAKTIQEALPTSVETPYQTLSKVPSSASARALYAGLGGSLAHAVNKAVKNSNTEKIKTIMTQLGTKSENRKGLDRIIDSIKSPESLNSAIKIMHNNPSPDLTLDKVLKITNPNSADYADKVREYTKILNKAGIDTSKLGKELPTFFKLAPGLDPIKAKEIPKVLTDTLFTATNAPKINAWINNHADAIDSPLARKFYNARIPGGIYTGLATAGALAPELISGINKVKNAIG